MIIFVASRVKEGVYGNSMKIKVPVVCLDRQIYVPGSDRVVLDQLWEAYNITKHLIERGHKRIAHIAGPSDYLTAQVRKEGYTKALIENNIRLIQRLIVEGDYSAESGRMVMEQLFKLEYKHTAVFATNDLMALGWGAMDSIRRKGLNISDDIAIAGFNDIPFASLYAPSLTTVSQHTFQMCSLAIQMIIDRLTGNFSMESCEAILQPTIVIREST